MTVLDLTAADVTKGETYPNTDIEDSIHYVLSQKHKCDAIVTNNVSDFIYFRDIEVLKPEKRLLSLKVK
jgi:predicted nucleic acid-binding protein